MKLALYHGYALSGSGSNEYTRYLARALTAAGHEVVVICAEQRDDEPYRVRALPRPPVLPVYLTDKQRPGVVKAFVDLSDDELAEYRRVIGSFVAEVLAQEKPEVVLCNHLVMQPAIVAATGARYLVIPHGSAVEYAIRPDARYAEAALEGLRGCAGVIWISDELRQRVHALLPEAKALLAGKEHRVNIGTDTAKFAPLPGTRADAFEALAQMHRSGGKTPAQRDELVAALRRQTLDVVRNYWDAYDHGVEDADLPQSLRAIPEDAELIGFMGALTWGKGVHTLIAAMPEVLRKHPRAHLLVIGSGTYREALEALVVAIDRRDDELLGRLIAAGRGLDRDAPAEPLSDLTAYLSTADGPAALRSAEGHLADHVTFVGRLDHERLQLLLPACRVAAFPSVIPEASPLVLAECLSAGVLPCGADHSGLRNGIEELRGAVGDNLIDAMKIPAQTGERVAGTARALGRLLDYGAASTLRAELRELAVARYDWRSVAGAIITACGRG